MTFRIAVVTDIHHGRDSECKKGASALALLDEFRHFVAREAPDLVLELGDRISDENPEADPRLEREVHAAFEPIRALAAVHHICGNHDRDFLSVRQNEDILGQRLEHEILDAGAWQIVLFRADTLIHRPDGFHCPDSDIDWLAARMLEAEKPTLIASHVPVSGHSQIGNYYFQENPAHSTYPQAARLREAARSARVPLAWIAGHVHWNTVTTIDGIAHLTQQSLTESFVTGPLRGEGLPSGAYGLIELGAEALTWEVFGLDRFRLALPIAQLARRWYPPLPDFRELPGHLERSRRIAAFHAAAEVAE